MVPVPCKPVSGVLLLLATSLLDLELELPVTSILSLLLILQTSSPWISPENEKY